jgi:hypothetical protein
MGIIAANIIIGGNTVLAAPKPIERNVAGSFQALREKLYSQLEKESPSKQLDDISSILPPPKKTREVDSRLIQYKESAFLSDMLSSSKD